MNETDFRECLLNMAADVPPPSVEAVTVVRRARQRVLRNLAAALATLSVIVIGAAVAAQTFKSDRAVSPVDAPSALINDCHGSGMRFAQSTGTVTRVAGRYPTNVRNLIAWLAGRNGPKGPGAMYSQWNERDGDAGVLVCVYDGHFNVQKGPPGGSPSPQTALSLIIAEGESPVLDSVGAGPFKWVFAPAPPGCHGEPGCDALGVCEWEVDAPVPCGRGVQEGRSYRYRILAHCGIRQAWFDGRLWQADPIIEDARSYSSRSEIAEGTMTLVGSNEARFVVVDRPPVVFRAAPPPSPFPCD